MEDNTVKSKPNKSLMILLVVLIFSGLFFYLINNSQSTASISIVENHLRTMPDSSTARLHILSEGLDYQIYQPSKDAILIEENLKHTRPILSTPENVVADFMERFYYLDSIVAPFQPTTNNKDASAQNRARLAYLSLMKSVVSGLVYGAFEKSVNLFPNKQYKVVEANSTKRIAGEEFPYLGETMIGMKRLDSLQDLLISVLSANIAGDVMETGIWRGGTSIFMSAVLQAYHQQQSRRIFACDSFRGLPPGNASLHPGDLHWDDLSYFSVDSVTVAKNFYRYQLLNEHVIFAKGFFNVTMPALVPIVNKLALLRLDGDIYESTADVLYHMYDKLSLGGILILDDWFDFPAQQACLDFFKVHKINPKIIPIDKFSVYWVKDEEVKTIQFWRYQQKNFV